MLRLLRAIIDDGPEGMRAKLIGLIGGLVLMNGGVWVLALVVFHHYPLLLGTALLAYSFGLRHAVDADHIAAIDNVTRKLMQEGKRPVAVGFFFSLGHSTIVVALSVVVALTTVSIQRHFPAWREVGGTIGTLISAGFLLLIAGLNLMVLCDLLRGCRTPSAAAPDGAPARDHTAPGGIIGRLCRPLFALIGRSWQMYPLGVLFGLGFDTATEVGVLGISASQTASGLPVWAILIFPALFTVGMSLIDTLDGVLMLGAYGWAFVKPVRKLSYNLVITGVSVVVALLVGGIEVLGLVAGTWHLEGTFWAVMGNLSDHFGMIGSLIIALAMAGWLISVWIYRLKGFDRRDEPVG